jgi:hypothetical protein
MGRLSVIGAANPVVRINEYQVTIFRSGESTVQPSASALDSGLPAGHWEIAESEYLPECA